MSHRTEFEARTEHVRRRSINDSRKQRDEELWSELDEEVQIVCKNELYCHFKAPRSTKRSRTR